MKKEQLEKIKDITKSDGYEILESDKEGFDNKVRFYFLIDFYDGFDEGPIILKRPITKFVIYTKEKVELWNLKKYYQH